MSTSLPTPFNQIPSTHCLLYLGVSRIGEQLTSSDAKGHTDTYVGYHYLGDTITLKE
jgi:hypothetical protein